MIVNPRLVVSLVTSVAFAVAGLMPLASAAELPAVSAHKAVSIAPKRAARARLKVPLRSDLLASFGSCSHLGCRGYLVLGVAF
jgi:hypothetical protein